MTRRKRPGLPPINVQLIVAYCQTGRSMDVAEKLAGVTSQKATALEHLLLSIAALVGCDMADLQLDHTWLLRDRAYKPKKGKPIAAWYTPHAHDPAYLRWRSKRPQDSDSHAIKTYVRGDRGQLSDVALAKRARRRENEPDKWKGLRALAKPKRRQSESRFRSGRRIPSRPFAKRRMK